MNRAPVTNQRVAEDLGVTHSGISRIRSGKRHPSVTLMREIERVYRWKLDRQVRLLGSVLYSEEFERALAKHYAQDSDEAAS